MKKWINAGIILISAGIIVLFYFLDPEKYIIFPKCTFNSLTGLYCPGCGSQRALHNLVHFNIGKAASNNFLFIPAILLLVYHFTREAINKRFGCSFPDILINKKTPWFILGIIVIFGILRNIPVFPFDLLGPE